MKLPFLALIFVAGSVNLAHASTALKYDLETDKVYDCGLLTGAAIVALSNSESVSPKALDPDNIDGALAYLGYQYSQSRSAYFYLGQQLTNEIAKEELLKIEKKYLPSLNELVSDSEFKRATTSDKISIIHFRMKTAANRMTDLQERVCSSLNVKYR